MLTLIKLKGIFSYIQYNTESLVSIIIIGCYMFVCTEVWYFHNFNINFVLFRNTVRVRLIGELVVIIIIIFSLQFLCHCVNQSAVELVAFWLDVEHFKHFDGGDEDVKLFAHHIG